MGDSSEQEESGRPDAPAVLLIHRSLSLTSHGVSYNSAVTQPGRGRFLPGASRGGAAVEGPPLVRSVASKPIAPAECERPAIHHHRQSRASECPLNSRGRGLPERNGDRGPHDTARHEAKEVSP